MRAPSAAARAHARWREPRVARRRTALAGGLLGGVIGYVAGPLGAVAGAALGVTLGYRPGSPLGYRPRPFDGSGSD